ncbi:hypothetical protein [Flavobacterium ajazii]|uniref:hypothetical protein n=1 Tax=Flavobacterium ajazii TaxID=2692318 RepID=UPI0013D0B65F|nr:hypothetical protein [Flavobacterium ajazii]
MENIINNILIFATNIKTKNDKEKISTELNENPEIIQWNIDQEDIDCVLRIVSETISEEQIINILNKHNFNCTPLE